MKLTQQATIDQQQSFDSQTSSGPATWPQGFIEFLLAVWLVFHALSCDCPVQILQDFLACAFVPNLSSGVWCEVGCCPR